MGAKKVNYPEWKYLGIPGKKLSTPILFVHGLGDDYETWGVSSTVDKNAVGKGDVCFQKGLVKKYKNGSAPAIIARSQNIDNSEKYINQNGIYFFQAPGAFNEEKWEEASLDWGGKDESNSQSRKLYKKLEEILDDHFAETPINWRETPEVTVDIVAHSQGGLVVREMLRGLRAEGASSGPENPANHIGRMISVDTPHLGAATAAENSESNSIKDYFGLGEIIDDLNASKNHTLARVDVSLDYTDWLVDLGISAINYLLGWGATVAVLTSDYEVDMKGPYLGPYTISLNVDPLGPGSFDTDIMNKDPLADYRERINYTRNIGKHLDSKSEFMQNLNKGKNGESYTKKPNGDNLKILPLYSGNTKAVVSAALSTIAENLKISCPDMDDTDSKAACVSLESYLESRSNDFEDLAHGMVDIDDIDLTQDLLDVLNSLVNDWLANSDLIVETESQKYQSRELGITSDAIAELENPRSFIFHDALAPWETVAHLDLKMGNMAASARQGLDIACALNLYCDELLAERADAKVIYLDDGFVDLTGKEKRTSL